MRLGEGEPGPFESFHLTGYIRWNANRAGIQIIQEAVVNHSVLRSAMILLTLITAVIHLFLGVSSLSDPDNTTLAVLFLLNFVGYIALLAAVLGLIPFVPVPTAHYLLMAFAAATIVAWFITGDPGKLDPLALFTNADEVLLIIIAFLHLQALQQERPA